MVKILLILLITVSLLFSQDLITGTTASGTSLVDIPVWQLKLSDIIGLNTLKCKYVTLNGLKNTLSIDIVGIATEFDLNSAGGSLTADLQLVKLIVAAEGDENSRHFVGIEGTIGSYELRLELDFKPGMSSVTTAIVKENIEPTPYKLVITNLSTDQTLVFESKEIPNNQDVTAGLPVTFNQAIPPRVKLLETVTISFKVDQSRVSAYRFKLDVPGDWTGGIKYAIFKWSDWTNDTGQSISYSAFEKEGTYKFTVEFRDKSSGRTRKIVKEFQVYWEYPEIRFEAIDIDFHYIRRAPDEKEKYRRAAEEYKKAYDMWMRKFEYEYKMLRLTGNTAEELVQAVSAGIVKKSAHVALANVNAPPVFGHLLSGLTLYSIIKEGYITLATVYRNIEANKAASMAIVTHALYLIYWGKFENTAQSQSEIQYYVKIFSEPKFGNNLLSIRSVESSLKNLGYSVIRCILEQDLSVSTHWYFIRKSDGLSTIIGPYHSQESANIAQKEIIELAGQKNWYFLSNNVIPCVERTESNHLSNKDIILKIAKEIIDLLHIRNFSALNNYINDSYGLRFSPYYYFEDTDKIFSKYEFLNLNYNKKYNWGYYQGRDGSIILNFIEYYQMYLYNNPYKFADQISYNKIIHSFIREDVLLKELARLRENNMNFVEFFYNGRERSGTIGSSIRLIFRVISGKVYLVAIISDPWTP